MLSLVLRALIAAPANAATFADVANEMLKIAAADGDPVEYRNFIRNRFTVREVIVSPVPLTEDHDPEHEHEAAVVDPEGAVQDRRACCGTMNNPEYWDWDGYDENGEAVEDEPAPSETPTRQRRKKRN
jgi:hypothetical protein